MPLPAGGGVISQSVGSLALGDGKVIYPGKGGRIRAGVSWTSLTGGDCSPQNLIRLLWAKLSISAARISSPSPRCGKGSPVTVTGRQPVGRGSGLTQTDPLLPSSLPHPTGTMPPPCRTLGSGGDGSLDEAGRPGPAFAVTRGTGIPGEPGPWAPTSSSWLCRGSSASAASLSFPRGARCSRGGSWKKWGRGLQTAANGLTTARFQGPSCPADARAESLGRTGTFSPQASFSLSQEALRGW